MAINKTEPQTVAAKTASAVEGLSREETKHVKEALRPRAAVVYEIVRTEGEAELIRPFSALWWSGVAAGISIGFSFLSEAALAALLPASDWHPIIAKLGYAVGFLIVILGRQQLFTENVLTAVLPVISRRKLDWLVSMLRLWGIVLAANVVGCFVFALALSALPIAGADVTHELGQIVLRVMQNSPFEMFAKGRSVEQVMAALDRAASTIWGYLTDFVATTHPEHLNPWVDQQTYRAVAEAIEEVGSSYLKPIHDHLGGQMPYHRIRLVATHLKSGKPGTAAH